MFCTFSCNIVAFKGGHQSWITSRLTIKHRTIYLGLIKGSELD